MREHPIPQDITGYRFHIIGSMTLKQFLQLGGGIVFAIIIYKSGLPNLISWPIVLLSAVSGAAIAFVPFEERSLDHWISTYFGVMFKPTKYFWKREPRIPDYFLYKTPTSSFNLEDETDLTPAKKARIKEYLTSIDNTSRIDPYDQAMNQRSSGILNQFLDPTIRGAESASHTNPVILKPSLESRTRSIRQVDSLESESILMTLEPKSQLTDSPINNDSSMHIYQEKLSPENNVSSRRQQPQSTIGEVAESIKIVETPLIKVTDSHSNSNTGRHNINLDSVNQPNIVLEPVKIKKETELINQVSTETVFNSHLPFPSSPDTPNKVVGMITNSSGELVPGAMIEIKDKNGGVVRVVKSNALGQFFVTTPLPIGNYIISTESDGLRFNPTSLSINNTVVAPIEIKAV